MEYNERQDIVQQRSYSVVKSNEIIQKARYSLNIAELKTLAYIFSKIKPTDKELKPYPFSIKEYCQVCGIDYANGKNYRTVKKSLKALGDKSFWMVKENGAEKLVRWLRDIEINPGSGKILVELHPDVHKYVLGLFENFTQYELLSTLPMKSSYSFRIYELLKSYAYRKKHVFDIEDLKGTLGASHYTNFKDFRKYVLEVATREINLYTDLEVSWEPIKKGRKVIQVDFNIRQRDAWGRYQAGIRATNEIDGQIGLTENE